MITVTMNSFSSLSYRTLPAITGSPVQVHVRNHNNIVNLAKSVAIIIGFHGH